MIWQAAGRKVLLRFEGATRAYKQLTTGHKIYLVSELPGNREKYATVVGQLHSKGYRCKDLNADSGDTVAVSYHVCANYTLKDDGVTVYGNYFSIGNECLWAADDWTIMAKKVGDKWVAVGDWVLMKETFTQPFYHTSLALPEMSTSPILNKSEGKYMSGDIDAKEGDVVLFKEDYRSVYEIEGENYIVLKKDRIIGKK